MKTRLLILATIILTSVGIINASTIYVDINAAGTGNGSSWTDAYTQLQVALDAATSGDEVWVAKGTYLPTTTIGGTNVRDKAFQMVDNVSIYGGFAGTETALAQRTDYGFGETNETILSGDFDGDDVISGSGSTLAISNNSENCYHIFNHPVGYALTSSAVIDGFTLKGGFAGPRNDPAFEEGGAIFNQAGQSPTINNCYFIGNEATDQGGAIKNASSANATITNCTFTKNMAGADRYGEGGAIANISSNAAITNCLFVGNTVNDGLNDQGGAIYNDASNPIITNSTIIENYAKTGGGIYNTSNSNPVIKNSIIWGNIVGGGAGSQVNNDNSNPTFAYCDIDGGWDGAGVANSGSTPVDGGGNINSYPKFVGSNQNASHPYSIVEVSPCADAGDNSVNSEAYDIRGNGFGRKLDKATGNAGTIDIGAYEYKYGTDPYIIPIYVDDDAAGANDGSSWTNAYTSFQSALNVATSGDQIWVAKGTYKPSSAYDLTNTSRHYHFRMIEGVEIYGGFAGTETSPSQRTDYGLGEANETILSGDIGTIGDNTDNCYHVFYHRSIGLTNAAKLDGFTITAGYANDPYPDASYGAGMLNFESAPSIINCTFSSNTATGSGGGIYNFTSSSIRIDSCILVNNSAQFSGGGIFIFNSSTTISNSTFKNNSVTDSSTPKGGAIYLNNSSTIINCLFTGNTAQNNGGTIYFDNSGSTIINSTITKSSSPAVYSYNIFLFQNPIFKNTLIWGNDGATIINDGGGKTPTFYHCDIEGGGGSTSWDTGLGTDGGNNIDSDPLFADATSDDFRLINLSPCADAGDNSANSETYDIRGNGFGRKLNKETGATGGTIDIGAYEYKHGTDPYISPVFYVDATAVGSNDGTSWANAYTSLQSALDVATSGREIWVAKGTYKPSYAYGLTDESRYYHFRMIDGVAIYGGFAGTESATSERANYAAGEANETILSGDYNDDDIISGSGSTLSITNNTENSYHVFYHPSGMNLTTTAILDGFTISGGNADGTSPQNAGSGMHNNASSPSVNQCTFIGNTSSGDGAGIYNNNSSANISNCTFITNSAPSGWGAGINNSSTTANISNCNFTGNSAALGGGINNDNSSSPIITNSNFSNNYAVQGGGMSNSSSSPIVTNCVFTENSVSANGGGIYINSSSPNISSPSIINCTFTQNTAGRAGGIYSVSIGSTPSISNTIVWGNTASTSDDNIHINYGSNPTFSYCDIEGSGGSSSWVGATFGTDGGNNIDTDPQFVNSGDYPSLIYGTSPCADAGNNSLNSETTDIRGGSFVRKLSKVDGSAGTIDMGAYEFNFDSDPLASPITWDGSASSDWNTAANWSGDAVPTATDDVIIPTVATNNPVIAALASADCNNLTINSGGVLTIQSTVSGTGSLITTGTFTNNGTFTVERFLNDAAWHFVSPSTTGVTANNFYWNDAPVSWLTSHDETDDSWTYNTDLGTTMPLGKGWAVWVDNATKSSAIASMTGDIQTTDLLIGLAKSGNGWNLIGNPFTSAIDCDAINWTSANRQIFTTGTQYVWDNDYNGGDYRTWNGTMGDLTDGIIPISQAFFVQAIYAGNLSIPTSARVHNSTAYYKSSESNGESPYVRLQLDFENHGNTVFIGFPEYGTSYFDYKGDATKLYSNDQFPQIFVVEDGVELSTNALAPLHSESKTVPLHLDQVVDGEYTLTLSQLDNLPDMMISLEDLQTGTIHDFINNSVYTFNASIGDDVNRFLLHFKSTTFGINEDLGNENESINIYTANNSLYIRSTGTAIHEAGNVEVYSIVGQKLLYQKIEAGALVSIPLNVKNSYLVVRINKPSGTIVKKVFTK